MIFLSLSLLLLLGWYCSSLCREVYWAHFSQITIHFGKSIFQVSLPSLTFGTRPSWMASSPRIESEFFHSVKMRELHGLCFVMLKVRNSNFFLKFHFELGYVNYRNLNVDRRFLHFSLRFLHFGGFHQFSRQIVSQLHLNHLNFPNSKIPFYCIKWASK